MCPRGGGSSFLEAPLRTSAGARAEKKEGGEFKGITLIETGISARLYYIPYNLITITTNLGIPTNVISMLSS